LTIYTGTKSTIGAIFVSKIGNSILEKAMVKNLWDSFFYIVHCWAKMRNNGVISKFISQYSSVGLLSRAYGSLRRGRKVEKKFIILDTFFCS
jgi:hypothetical protein